MVYYIIPGGECAAPLRKCAAPLRKQVEELLHRAVCVFRLAVVLNACNNPEAQLSTFHHLLHVFVFITLKNLCL